MHYINVINIYITIGKRVVTKHDNSLVHISRDTVNKV